MPHCLYVGTLTDLSGFSQQGGFGGRTFFISLCDDCLHGWLLSWLFTVLAVVARRPARFFLFLLDSATYLALNNVLSSGLPLPAPGLSGSLFVSCLRGLGSGCPAERRLGEVVLWLSLQSLPWIGCFLRLCWCGLLQSSVILHGSNHGIPILHGKISRIHSWFNEIASECRRV